jgi:aminobenzoyl-glutamate utilization protein B
MVAPAAKGASAMRNEEEIWRLVDARRDRYVELSDRIWGMPELCYDEHRSCAEHAAMLEAEGFRITKEVAGIPTAVMGEAGEGGPVIAILGEYDALPGLQPGSRRDRARPVPGETRGHGCGHNLLGSASLMAGRRGEGLAEGQRAARPRALLWLPRPRRAARQGLHVPRRRLRRRGHRICWHPTPSPA